MVRYRNISIKESIYQRLNRLAAERGKSMSDLIEELLNNYEGKASSGVVGELGEIKAMLRECLDRFSVRETKPIETRQTEPVPAVPKNETDDSAFEGNPWVQILRTKYRS
jgi:predicted CopG family antitoxin